MSVYDDLPIILASEDAVAPFMDCCEITRERLARIGAVTEKNEVCEAVIGTLARACASNFYDSFAASMDDGDPLFEAAYEGLTKIWASGETIGTYLYILTCGNMIDCALPKELPWIARNEEVLTIYLRAFMDALLSFEPQVSVNDGRTA